MVDEIAGQLGQDCLVTVTGPGGAGKTRPAAEVAKQVAGRFADGVWLAELAAVQDPVQVPAAAATALGIRDLPSIAAADALATSREPLRIAGEVRYRLGPLTLPDLDNPAAGGACEAVTLSANRARASNLVSRSTRRPAGYALAFGFVAKHFLQRGVVRWHTMAREPATKRTAHADRLPASSRW